MTPLQNNAQSIPSYLPQKSKYTDSCFFFYVERLTELIQFITRLKTIKKNQLFLPFAILDLRQLD